MYGEIWWVPELASIVRTVAANEDCLGKRRERAPSLNGARLVISKNKSSVSPASSNNAEKPFWLGEV